MTKRSPKPQRNNLNINHNEEYNSKYQLRSTMLAVRTTAIAVFICVCGEVNSYSPSTIKGLRKALSHDDFRTSLSNKFNLINLPTNSPPRLNNLPFTTLRQENQYECYRKSNSALFMSSRRDSNSSTDSSKNWSRAATIEDIETDNSVLEDENLSNEKGGNGSRFGVRSRVRSVLQKAKKRTGISNNSDRTRPLSSPPKPPSPQSVIAEAASIGGLGAVIIDEEGTIDVALDYSPSVSLRNSTETDITSETTDQRSITSRRKPQKRAPASTYSPPPVKITTGPEDLLSSSNSSSTAATPISERDAFTGDVSAAFSLPPPPLPFTLPKLTPEQTRQVNAGERVQFQSDMKREGSGFVVVDVKAPARVVWDCLLDFESYPETIPTVRSVEISKKDVSNLKNGVPSETSAAFSLSKFRLRVAAIHKYRPHPLGDHMIFTLDPSCTNLVLQKAKGVWYTEENVDGREGITRVWLLCELKVSNMLPMWIVDYAAKKAMPRATSWLKPQVEAAASLWLRKDANER